VAKPRDPLVNQLKAPGQLHRLGKNVNGYLGETIDIRSVLADCVAAAKDHAWKIEDIPVDSAVTLIGLTRPARSPAQPSANSVEPLRVYLSAGIHGDEPAGPLAASQLLHEDNWPQGVDLWFCPCLNPSGFMLNRRENRQGLDLNRQYLQPEAAETRAHIGWLERHSRFDLCLCLHEDWESHGFYVYELNPDDRPSLAELIIRRVMDVCPIDLSDSIEGRPAHNGIIRPSVDPSSRPQWRHKTNLSYTLEAPSDFPLAVRVAALVAGVQAALEALAVNHLIKRPRPEDR
jgi:protein MpaA